jgi:two-component system response regulator RegA
MKDFILESLLFCDDDTAFRERLVKSATSKGYNAFAVEGVDSALNFLSTKSVDALILDLRMPDKSGLELMQQLRSKNLNMRIVILTGYGSIQTAIDSIRLGAHNYLTKPATFQSILSAILAEAGSFDAEVYVPSLEEVQSEYVNRVIDYNQGNISKAAKDLGLHRRSLQRKINKH